MTSKTNKQALAKVYKHQATRASEFLDMLSPVSGVFSGPGGRPHGKLYRGVGDAQYTLLPTAYRPNSKLFQPPSSPRGPGATNGEQITRELWTLRAFMMAIDRQGHKIPEDSQKLRADLKSLANAISYTSRRIIPEWPPSSLLSVLALAQHYGAPTRMLDWSLDPYVAAYFAAESAVNGGDLKGDLAVWLCVANLFDVNEILLNDAEKINKLAIQYVTVPWAENANAKAQRAVFLAHRQFDIAPDAKFDSKSYDELLAGSMANGYPSTLYRLALPKSEASALLRLLAFQGYDGATMFPGIDGAVKSLYEMYLWPKEIGTDPRTPGHKDIFDKLIKDIDKP